MDFEIRKGKGSTGRRPLTRERAAYFALMNQGCSSAEACRIVGVNRRTGKVWRNGHHAPGKGKTSKPPIYQPVMASGQPSRYLQEPDRVHIADSLRAGACIRTIAGELGRAPSAISREVRRNRHPTNHQYRPHAAQARADARRPRPKPGKIGRNPQLQAVIAGHLALRWSRSRSATLCAGGFLISRSCMWPTRPSTRPSTCKAAVSCAGSWPGPCAPAGHAAAPPAGPAAPVTGAQGHGAHQRPPRRGR